MKEFTKQFRLRMAMLSAKPLLLTLFALLGFSLNAMADETGSDLVTPTGGTVVSGPTIWDQVSSDDYAQHTVVYAGLVDADGNDCDVAAIKGATLYAFIGDECRAKADFQTYSTETASLNYYALKVGGTSADMGKEITFKVVYAGTAIYTVTTLDGTKVTYSGDETAVMPSNRLKLVYNPITNITLNSFTVNVGETQNLLDIMTLTPAGASYPDNFDDLCTWECDNASTYGQIVTGTNGPELKGLKSTAGQDKYLGFTYSALNLTTGTSFIVYQPITDVTLSDGYSASTTAFVGDNTTLTNYLAKCYAITPADADTKLVWTTEDATIVNITQNATDASTVAEPLKIGTVKLYLKEATRDAETGQYVAGEKTWLTLTVTVEQKPTSISLQLEEIFAPYGNNVADLIKANYTVLPADATNKEVTITVEDETLGDEFIVLSSYMVTVTSVADPTVSANFFINGVRKVEFDVKEPELKYSTNNLPSIDEFRQDIKNNITLPESIYVEDIITGDEIYSEETGFNGKTGTMTYTYNYMYLNTHLNDGVLTTVTDTTSASFKVTVYEGLSAIYVKVGDETVDPLRTVKNESTTFTLVTDPADYELDENLLTVTVHSATYDDTRLIYGFVSNNEDGSYTITTLYPGYGELVINYDGEEYTCQVNSCDKFTIDKGWAWYTFLQGGELTNYFGEGGADGDNKIVEMRSQSELLYNDPVYGYFGDIDYVYDATCYKIKANETFDIIRDGNGEDEVGYSIDLTSGYEFPLSPKYNWIPNKYVESHEISEAIESTPNADDVILACSGDIATWTGTAWTGTLTTFDPYRGYIYYNAGEGDETLLYAPEASLAKPESAKVRRVAAERQQSVWTYDRSEYPNVMAIIANVDGIENSRRFSIGAFVGNECRGEGTCVDGKFYIGVSGKAGEKVTFKLYDDVTGEYADIVNELPFAQLVGLYSNPYELVADMTTTGITTATTSALHSSDAYNTMGVRVNSNAKGIVITKDGKKYLNK